MKSFVSIVDSIFNTWGDEFYKRLALAIDETVKADVTLIGRLNRPNHSIRTVAVVMGREIVDNFEYELADSPCDDLLCRNIAYIERDVASLYPNDCMLVEGGFNAYVAVPLTEPSGEPIGIMVTLFKEPLEVAGAAEAMSTLMKLFSGRVSGEMIRQDRERLLEAELNLRRGLFRSLAHELRTPVAYGGDDWVTSLSAAISPMEKAHLLPEARIPGRPPFKQGGSLGRSHSQSPRKHASNRRSSNDAGSNDHNGFRHPIEQKQGDPAHHRCDDTTVGGFASSRDLTSSLSAAAISVANAGKSFSASQHIMYRTELVMMVGNLLNETTEWKPRTFVVDNFLARMKRSMLNMASSPSLDVIHTTNTPNCLVCDVHALEVASNAVAEALLTSTSEANQFSMTCDVSFSSGFVTVSIAIVGGDCNIELPGDVEKWYDVLMHTYTTHSYPHIVQVYVLQGICDVFGGKLHIESGAGSTDESDESGKRFVRMSLSLPAEECSRSSMRSQQDFSSRLKECQSQKKQFESNTTDNLQLPVKECLISSLTNKGSKSLSPLHTSSLSGSDGGSSTTDTLAADVFDRSDIDAIAPGSPQAEPVKRPANNEEVRILVVDDVLMNRKLLRRMLNKAGFSIVEAADGQEAVNKVKEHVPHLILMDVQMPVMNGLVATSTIREYEKTLPPHQLPSGPHIPIIGVSANADLQSCIKSGMDILVPKPVSSQDLLANIELYLSN